MYRWVLKIFSTNLAQCFGVNPFSETVSHLDTLRLLSSLPAVPLPVSIRGRGLKNRMCRIPTSDTHTGHLGRNVMQLTNACRTVLKRDERFPPMCYRRDRFLREVLSFLTTCLQTLGIALEPFRENSKTSLMTSLVVGTSIVIIVFD